VFGIVMSNVVLLPDALLTYAKIDSPPNHAELELPEPVVLSFLARIAYKSDEPPGMPVPPVTVMVSLTLVTVFDCNEARVVALNI
jgi:hypothetical protein